MIDGRYVKNPEELIDLRGQKIHDTKIRIPRSEIKDMQNYGPWHNDYMALDFTMTGLHMLHVLAGCVVIGYLWLWGRKLWDVDPEHFTNRGVRPVLAFRGPGLDFSISGLILNLTYIYE